MHYNDARGWGAITYVLKFIEVIKFQISQTFIYYIVHFCFLLEHICEGEPSEEVVIESE